jgi:6-phosphogluconolactonase
MSGEMSVRRHTLSDAASAAEACAHHVIGLLEEVLSGQEFATLAISGGSTPKLLFQKLAASKFQWDHVHLFWVDERCVPPTDEESNYKLAEESLIKPAHIPDRLVHRVHGELAPEAAAQRYVDEIRDFFGLSEGEMPRFDVVHRGIGPDAHTASLFPGDPSIANRDDIAAAVFSKAKSSGASRCCQARCWRPGTRCSWWREPTKRKRCGPCSRRSTTQ